MAKAKPPKFERQRYVLKQDQNLPPEQQTVWILKPLSLADMTRVKDLMATGERSVSALHLAARRGIVGWENLEGLEFKGEVYLSDRSGDGERRCTDAEWETVAGCGLWAEEIGKYLILLGTLEDTEKNF